MNPIPDRIPEGYEPVVTPLPVVNRRRRHPIKFTRTSTMTIMATDYPPIRWIVPGYVSEGLSLLAGRQKLGKTWLAIDWAIAVNSGGMAMGSVACELGDVLYIDLENGPRRIQRRLETLCPSDASRSQLTRLDWVTASPALDAGFIDALEEWRTTVAKPRLVIIDVLQRIKPAGAVARNSYENDYAALSALQQWATEQCIGVVALMHTRKGGADDPLEAVSGSNGMSACADSTLVLDRGSNGTTLYVRGRDVEEKESALKFSSGYWSLIGEAADVRRSDERGTIMRALDEADDPMSPTDLADVTGFKSGNIRRLLFSMVKSGEVVKVGRGKYESSKGVGNNVTSVTTMNKAPE